MRIAYVCADRGVPVFGRKGCSIHVQEIIRTMLRRGHTVDLFASRPDGTPPDDLRGVRVHRLPVFNPSSDGRFFGRDIVRHANDTLDDALSESGRFDLIYERYALWSYAAQEFATRSGTLSVLEVNAPLISEQATWRGLEEPELAEETTARAFGSTSSLIAVSEEVAGYLRKRPEASQRVTTVSNGVDPHRFRNTDRSRDEFVIGFVGTLKPWHGVSVLIEAFEQFTRSNPKPKLRIVGDGPEREALVKQVHRTMPDRTQQVQFVGAVEHDCVPRVLSSFDIAVAPYPHLADFYFSPLKVLEYMATGCAVIASRIGEPARIIDHHTTGVLCEPGNASDLSAGLTLLSSDEGLRRSLGQAAREQIIKQHTWDHAFASILATTGQYSECAGVLT